MAVMVWCNSCKTVVWAYDHQPHIDLRGICNMLKLPCPKCGDQGNFNGWGHDNPITAIRETMKNQPATVYDVWSALKWMARYHKADWEPSPDNTWFSRPDGSNLWELYSDHYEAIGDKEV